MCTSRLRKLLYRRFNMRTTAAELTVAGDSDLGAGLGDELVLAFDHFAFFAGEDFGLLQNLTGSGDVDLFDRDRSTGKDRDHIVGDLYESAVDVKPLGFATGRNP